MSKDVNRIPDPLVRTVPRPKRPTRLGKTYPEPLRIVFVYNPTMLSRSTAIFLLFLLSAASCVAQVTPFTAKAVDILEGDAFTVLDSKKKEHKIRLAGIDAPESGQAFGDKAREHLSELILDQQLMIFSTRTDRYGRLVSQVFLYGKEISLAMIRAGFAWHLKEAEKEQPEKERAVFAAAETDARKAKLGLWADPDPIPPWVFRSERQEPTTPPAGSPTTADMKPGSRVLEIVGDRSTKIYHWNPGCPDLYKLAMRDRVQFKSKEEAEAAGYRAAMNCR